MPRTSSTSTRRSKLSAKKVKVKAKVSTNGVARGMAPKLKTKKKANTKAKKTKVKAKTTKSKVKAKKTKTKTKTKTKKTSAKKTSSTSRKINKKILLEAFEVMLRARLLDEKTIILYKQNKCHFQIGVAGHEAIQAAAGAVFRPGKDWFYPYYREMALMVALGMPNEDFMLMAMNKQDDPNSHGRQMPMHYGDLARNVVNQSSPTGTQFLQAVGIALGTKSKQQDEVTYVSAGEGTCSQGDFHEALNWAARDKLPVVFMIQNNGYAISVPVSEQLAGQSVYKIADGYENLAREKVDGTNFAESFKAVKRAHDRARKGKGPTLIEAFVPRLQSHSISDNHLKYRSEKDIKADAKRCPIEKLKKELIKKKYLNKKSYEELFQRIKAEIDQAAEWAEAQATPDPDRAEEFTYSDLNPSANVTELPAQGDDIYMVDALNHALDEELSINPDMYVFGQDVAHGKGGVFTVTAGLTKKHGNDRVFNAPLAESSIIGVAVGMATKGLKAVAEIQFGDYVWTGMMQLRNELAMMHYRSGGDFSCPAVIRIPVGGYIHGSAYHSQNIEATFAHFPGLYILLPSNATDAKGLLKSAIRCNNPVLFLEHKGLYRQVYAKGPEGDQDYLTPIGKAKCVKEGTDLTIITWGALVNKSIYAANHLELEGVSVEIIDVRSIVPLDTESIFESVRKTNRVLIAHEDVEFMGFGAEIATQIATHCFESLDAPIRRVAMKNVAAVPHSPVMEKVILPQNDDVLNAARDLLSY